MTELRERTAGGWLTTLVFSVACAGLVAAAAFVMFSAFMFYDDEGYILLSLRNYARRPSGCRSSMSGSSARAPLRCRSRERSASEA